MGGREYTISEHRYTSSLTPGDEFADTARRVTPQNVWAVYYFTDTGIRVHRTGIRVHRHRYTSSQTPVYEFTDTGSASHLQFWVTVNSYTGVVDLVSRCL